MKKETLGIQSTIFKDANAGAVVPPLYLSTTFEREPDGTFEHDFIYTRAENPNRVLLEKSMAAMENGAEALAFASGMAAITALLQSLGKGDHIILPADAYYTTILLAENVFGPWGLEFSAIDQTDINLLRKTIRKNTKLIWLESPSNPQLKVTDIAEISKIAHENGAICAVDNTWATPILQNPLDLGADVSMHASTKYIGGHSDVLGGILVFKDKNELFSKLKSIQKIAGAVPSPFDCWLLVRGIKTLALRVKAQTASTKKIAVFLESHPKIAKVYYPGLESHPNHAVAKKQMIDFGAMLSFEVIGGEKEALAFTGKVKLFTRATSLGGVESLIEHRKSIEGETSISPPALLRISVGVEDVDDLIADLESAL